MPGRLDVLEESDAMRLRDPRQPGAGGELAVPRSDHDFREVAAHAPFSPRVLLLDLNGREARDPAPLREAFTATEPDLADG